MPAFSRRMAEFEGLDTQVLGISVDSVPCNEAWEQSLGGLAYPLLSDFWPHGSVAERFGVLRSDGVTERAVIAIDKKGVIRYIDVHNIAEAPEPDPVIEIIRSWS